MGVRFKSAMIGQSITTGMLGAAATNYLVETSSGAMYFIYVDSLIDVFYVKSIDQGQTWTKPVEIFIAKVDSVAVWFDEWSGLAGGLIHIAMTDNNVDDILYRTINTASSDALSTQTTAWAGASAAVTGSSLSIARARGGNVYIRANIDGTAEAVFIRLLNANVPNGAWDAVRTLDETLATGDQGILLPGWNADNQDMTMIFWDVSADEISRKLYDDSANTWSEVSIATSMTEADPAVTWPDFAACVDVANSQFIVVAWSNTDVSTSRLRCWTVNDTTITAKTDVIASAAAESGMCAISIHKGTGYWYAFYCVGGTYGTDVQLMMKVSTDSGTTWGAETVVQDNTSNGAQKIVALFPCPRFLIGDRKIGYGVRSGTASNMYFYCNTNFVPQKANLLLGV